MNQRVLASEFERQAFRGAARLEELRERRERDGTVRPAASRSRSAGEA